MSILPPTDLVTEVAQAADPSRLRAAMTRLADLSRSRLGPESQFSSLLAGDVARTSSPSIDGRPAGPYSATRIPSLSVQNGAEIRNSASNPAKDFEAFIIQSCLQTILPKEEQGFFGQGTGGGIWRSMLAEQLANQISKAGGIGLNKVLGHRWTQPNVRADAAGISSPERS